MELIFTGKGSAGSWACRGDQLGKACGAVVKPMATAEDLAKADVAVVVKRVPPELLQALRKSRKPWVLDVVDFYPQPTACHWDRDQAIRWVRNKIAELNPTAIIWPNRQMQLDCPGCDDPAVNWHSTVLYHHHRPSIVQNPIRQDVKKVGYEGEPAYLAEWRPFLEIECARRGWEFVVNPPQLADLDIVVALRGGQYAGYVPSAWKSNIKVANAHGSGTPFIGNPECGYLETALGGEKMVSTKKQLREALDALTPYEERLKAREWIAEAYRVEDAALDLTAFLRGL